MHQSAYRISRPQNPHDIARLLKMLNAVYRPRAMPSQGMALEFPHLFDVRNAHNLFFAEADGNPISMVGVYPQKVIIQGAELPVASIGCVCTTPDYENQGIATSILNAVFDNLSRQQIPLALISGERGLYQRLGAVAIGSLRQVTAPADLLRNLGGHLQGLGTLIVTEASPSQRAEWASSLIPFYWEKSIRFRRSTAHMKTLLQAIWFVREGYDQRLFALSVEGRPVGYVVAYRSNRHPEQVAVMEWAGSLPLVLGGLFPILDLFHSETLMINLPAADPWLDSLLTALGILGREVAVQGTVRVLNKQALVTALDPLIQERHQNAIAFNQAFTMRSSKNGHQELFSQEILSRIFGQTAEDVGIPFPWTDDLNYI